MRHGMPFFCCFFSGALALGSMQPLATAEPIPTFTENFHEGLLNLNWSSFPGYSDNALTPILDPDTPQGDMWAGRQTNQQLGGFASLSYAGMASLDDYVMDAWVYTVVVPEGRAPLNGIAVRVDPEEGRFYRFATKFDSEPNLTFAYVGSDTSNYPVYLGTWKSENIPGGAPASSGWHKMAIRGEGDQFWVYWDGQELPGCPLKDDRISKGFFGVYATYVGGKGIIETRVDAITVSGNPPGEVVHFSFPFEK